MHAVVVGGGIAGLASAASLTRSGWRVTVLEAADDFSEIGAGFGLTPNGLTALATLGLGQRAVAASRPLTMAGTQDSHGRWLMRFDADSTGPNALRMYGMQRRELHSLLLEAAGAATLRRSAAVRAVEPGASDGESARVHFDVAGAPQTLEADLVVGADGVRSTVRGLVAPESRIRYSGMSSWRGIAEDRDLIDDRFAIMWGPGAEFGAVRVNAREVYWYGYVRMSAGTRHADEHRAAIERFAGWAEPVPQLLGRTQPSRVLRHDVYSLKPTAHRYVNERLVLVGDAAHAMLPTMGQGVNTALEDAVTLGRLMGSVENAGLGTALTRYGEARYRRTRDIQNRSAMAARFGSSVTSAPLVAVRNQLIRLVPNRAASSAAASLFRWQPPTGGRAD
jgi:2-polyprenyl-6-methoxyphenol hydroxylase-like FAD-dependent oxidoreductase